MTDNTPPQNGHIKARVRKNNTFLSAVWLIPLIALIAGGWLWVKEIRNRGPVVTLLMNSAEGIEVNKTVIKVLSVDVGRVTRIKLRDDQKGVEVTAQLNADVSDLIRSDTQFWVVKPRIDQSGVTGLGTLLSGSYIAFTPGKSDEAKDVFQVQDIPPIAAIGQSGLRLNLIGKNDRIL
ncbi:MAG: MCE family protein, partial [Neisseria sp.]